MQAPIIYVQSCPICGDGLCRVRVCCVEQRVQGFILCDECEAMWTDPSMLDRVHNDTSCGESHCPGTNLSVWDKNTHWANAGEVCLLGWFDQVRIEN
jgi:hypothetical protein